MDSTAIGTDADLRKYSDMKCDLCDIVLTDLQHAKDHYPAKHGIVNGYLRCCDAKLKKPADIIDHLRYHLNPNMFECPMCGQTFARRFLLQMHYRNHQANNEERYKCDVCHRKYATKCLLYSHKQIHYVQKLPLLKCDQCERKLVPLSIPPEISRELLPFLRSLHLFAHFV